MINMWHQTCTKSITAYCNATSKDKNHKNVKRKAVLLSHIMEETTLSDTFFVGMVTQEEIVSRVNRVELDRWTVALEVNGAIITLDTGTKARPINGLSIRAMKTKPQICPSTIPVKAYSVRSIFRPKVRVKGKQTQCHVCNSSRWT